MKPSQTAIAVTLALVVVIIFFIVPGLSPFGGSAPANEPAPITIETNQTPSATMPSEPITQLQVNDEITGTGTAAASGDTVTVDYVGSLTSGAVFDASKNHGTTGFTFVLGAGQVIKGWDLGVVGMKEGGKRMLFIPASLAYGDQAIGNVIPANSALIFEVELLKVQKAAR